MQIGSQVTTRVTSIAAGCWPPRSCEARVSWIAVEPGVPASSQDAIVMVFGAKSMPAAARIEPTYRTAPSRSARRRCSGSTTRPPADFVETANSIRPAPLCQAGGGSAVRPLGDAARAVEPLPICTRPRVLIKSKRT
jgi:hypothetical protein